jgi:asparagine synthase (glutamine-hydrolysing)
VFPLEGIPKREENEKEEEVEREEEGEEEEEEEEEIASLPVPMECDHDEELHELLAAQMAEALGQVSKDQLTEILPDAWKTWVLPRITIAPSHERMYSSEQILYHYTKDLTYLTRVVKCQQLSLCTDYLRDPPPKIAKEFRELLQKVLQGWTLPYPGGIDAIALSGGLDTSILAEASAQPWQSSEYGGGAISLDKSGAAKPILSFKHAFTVQANKQAQDAEYAKEIFGRLKDHSIQQQHILKPSLDELLQNATQVAKLLVTCDPMELRNSLVIYATLEAASRQGVRQIVTGDGADEIFCGYSFYAAMDEPKMLAYRDQIMDVMGFTAPTLARAFGMDVIAPFLDPRVLAFAKKISNKKDLVGERTPVPVHGPGVEYGKLLMRQAFPEAFSQWRWKQPIEQGAGTTALRLSHFENYCTAAEFDAAQKDAMVAHGVLVRDKEHLFFFRAFLEAFDQNLANVPKPRRLDASTKAGKTVDGYCPACGFQLSHAGQDFCVTCGFWPTCATRTNDSQGFATQALAKLESDKQRLLAKPKSWWRSRFWST